MMQILVVGGFNPTNINYLAGELACLTMNRGQKTILVDAVGNNANQLKAILGLANLIPNFTLSDWIMGHCDLEDTFYSFAKNQSAKSAQLCLMLAYTNSSFPKIADLEMLYNPLARLFDCCIIAAPAGIENTVWPWVAFGDNLYISADLADVQQAAVLVDTAKILALPDIQVIMNGVPMLEFISIQTYLEAVLGCSVMATFAFSFGQAVLSPQEIKVLHWMAAGETNKSIAFLLRCSPRTVNNIIAEIYAKLGISSRAEAVVYADRSGAL